MKPKLQRHRFEFFKEAYDRELVRRSEAMNRLGIIVTAFTVIGGMLAFYVNGLPSEKTTTWFYLFYAFLALGAGLALVGIVLFAVQTQKGVIYKVLGPAKDFEKTFTDLNAGAPDSDEMDVGCVHEFNKSLAEQYRDAATENQKANDLREKRTNRILRIVAWSATLLIFAAIPYIVAKHFEKKEPIEVTIQKPITISEQPRIPTK